MRVEDPIVVRQSDAAGVASPAAELLAGASRLLATERGDLRPLRPLLTDFMAATGSSEGGVFVVEDRGLRPVAIASSHGEYALRGAAAYAVGSNADLHVPCPEGTCRPPTFTVGSTPSVLCVPLVVGRAVLGALVVSREGDAPAYDGSALGLAKALSSQLATALDRAHALQELRRHEREGEARRRQLEHYANDLREMFAQEKRHAVKLWNALAELEETYLATVRGLAVAVEAKDAHTAGHLSRVTRFGVAILDRVAPELAEDRQTMYGFLLHDIGKLGVPDAILGKPGPLTQEEWAVVRRHPEIGRTILAGIPFLAAAREIVYTHHERWDGSGYPVGLRGDEIPLAARVFPLADVLDALTSRRPYRLPLSLDEARHELRRGSGTQFWPEAVEAMMSFETDELHSLLRDPVEDPTAITLSRVSSGSVIPTGRPAQGVFDL